jgi:hypothetical protein
MFSNMEREAFREPDLTDLGDLEFDIDFFAFYDLTEFPNFAWPSLIRSRPVAVVLDRKAEDYGNAIPFGQAQLRQRLHILASINDVNPTTRRGNVLKFPQELANIPPFHLIQ